MCTYITTVCLLLVQTLLILVDGTSLSLWKTQLLHFKRWEGHFMYQGKSHICSMKVLSVQADDAAGAMVSFSADGIKLDMNANSLDDIVIVFSKEAIYHAASPFYEDFQFEAEMMQHGSIHFLVGNITKPASNMSTISMHPEGTRFTNRTKSSKLSVGLAVGISITLFVICIVIGIVILRWAIRKGYLRHVARSYKSFRNPDSAVSFDNTQRENQPQAVNVHI